MTKIIGIGGPSQSGKSILAKSMKQDLSPKRVFIIEMDNYTLPASVIPNINGTTNWEVAESIDFDRILQTIDAKKSNHDIIIVEGILAFANERLNKLYSQSILLEISEETFLKRRKKETRWGKEPAWYLRHVWDSHLKYGMLENPDVVLSGEELPETYRDKMIREILQNT